MGRFTPATPRSRQLGRELRAAREHAGMTMDAVATTIGCSMSRISRIESGDIKVRSADVMELLTTYGVSMDSDGYKSLVAAARGLRAPSWWQRLGTLPSRYGTFIAYEAEASRMRTWEPILVPGMLQTEAYARAVIGSGHLDQDNVRERVEARLRRQQALHPPTSLAVHAVVAEAALHLEVGDAALMAEQCKHLVSLARQPHVTIQVLRYAAGAHPAIAGSFILLDGPTFGTLGYVETLAGDLFLEAPDEIDRLNEALAQLCTMAMSPRESVAWLKEVWK